METRDAISELYRRYHDFHNQLNVTTKVLTGAVEYMFSAVSLIASAPEMLDQFSREAERGIERVYLWMCDFAQPDTLAGFGEEVIGKMPVRALVS
jgi:hypothetical protein